MIIPPEHTYIPLADEALTSLFAEHEFPLFDYSDASALGATDEDFFDGWHASEKISAQLYLDLVAHVPALQAYTDSPALQQIIDNATDTFRVFPFVAPE